MKKLKPSDKEVLKDLFILLAVWTGFVFLLISILASFGIKIWK